MGTSTTNKSTVLLLLTMTSSIYLTTIVKSSGLHLRRCVSINDGSNGEEEAVSYSYEELWLAGPPLDDARGSADERSLVWWLVDLAVVGVPMMCAVCIHVC